MLRGYRFCIAALGLILLGAGPPKGQEADNKQPNTQQSIADSLHNISSRYDEQAERAKRTEQEEGPCGEGKHGGSTDLCAQWKAADAAADSAWWAWASAIVGLGSLAGVFLALGLAFHSNWIARDTAKRQLRAYLSTMGAHVYVRPKGGKDFHAIDFLIANKGQTPATLTNLSFQISHSFGGMRSKVFEKSAPAKTVIGGTSPTMNIPLAIKDEHGNPIDLLSYGGGRFLIEAVISYEDVFKETDKLEIRYMTVESFWDEFPAKRHECYVYDQSDASQPA